MAETIQLFHTGLFSTMLANSYSQLDLIKYFISLQTYPLKKI
jgi:hypothetical protein